MTKPIIVDSHCHLDFPDFEGEISELITNAANAGVMRMVTICTRLKNEPSVRAIAETYSSVYYAAGTHPMSASEEPLATVDQLIKIAEHPKMVGIGETGLDYHYTAESASIQKKSLRIHITAARETGLPLIIHSRAADDDMIEILQDEYKKGPYECVMHCFSSSLELAKVALELGFYLSMSGIVTFKKSQDLRDIFAIAPIEKILVETDSPYLSPDPYRGKRNEPAYTAHTAQVGAKIFGLEYKDFAAQTTKNFNQLFSKAAL
ncbi:MAG: TatD family hydrolase [Amylibacter sp.]|jgi:TatD DNase family protein|tara:strand:- start:1896 stop:2684 length:789 start_codon:yes stop_codon:yes gene_type:complete